MKFSIIIPAYNSSTTIKRTVESIVKQNVDKQIIIVDNNSIDDTYLVCEELKKEYKEIELYKCLKQGVSAARNVGLKHVKGDIVGFCDADDYYDETILEKIINIFSKKNIDIIFSAYTYVFNEKRVLIQNRKNIETNSKEAIKHMFCNSKISASLCNKFYKAEIIKYEQLNENIHYLEDGYFNLKILMKGDYKVFVMKDNSYYYVVNNESASNGIDNVYTENGVSEFIETLHLMTKEINLDEEEKEYIKDDIFRLSVYCIFDERIRSNKIRYNNYYNEIINNYKYFIKRLFVCDVKHRIKLAIKGLYIIIKGRIS